VGWLSPGSLAAATFAVPPAGSVGLREMAFPQLEDDDVRILLFENAPENRSPLDRCPSDSDGNTY
jgi:hypothetical protein